MEQLITIRSNKEEINEIKIDKEMPITNIRTIISREVANKLSTWNEVKKGSIDSELVGTFNPNTNESVEAIEIEPTPVVTEEVPVVEETPVIAEETPVITEFPTVDETPVVTESNDYVDENVVSEPDNSAELMFKDNEPVDEVPVNNMVSSEPSETLTELSNEPSDIVDTSVEEPIIDDNDEWNFDSDDQSVYDPDEELIEQEKHLMK